MGYYINIFIFGAIIIGCCFIKYPERVNGTVTITTAYSPIDVVSKNQVILKEYWLEMEIQ